MGAGEDADADGVGVFLDGGGDYLFRRLAEAGIPLEKAGIDRMEALWREAKLQEEKQGC